MSDGISIARPGVLLAMVLAVSIIPIDSVSVGQAVCAEGTLLEPYSDVCAPINDRRQWWLTPTEPVSSDQLIQATGGPPEAGTINVGTTYLNGVLTVTQSARLHTRMFVHPDGLNPADFLDWVFTTATNRVDSAVEVVGLYRTALGDSGVLSIFGRPCSVEYPCPDGDTANGWQPSKYFTELACNITHIVDDGGHSQKIVHYANHSDRLDEADPALWRNAVYLWNYCDEQWDLVWQHEYRENKRDCSVEGCYFWGTGLELPGDTLRPEVSELGFEDTLLYHDGTWSELGTDETNFRHPEDRPDLSPWVLFHLDPNRSFGAGNFLDLNDPPVIVDQQTLTTGEDQALELNAVMLTVEDPDVDPRFHAEFAMTAYGGDHYTRSGLTIVPDENYFGELQVPVAVSDGAADSPVYTLLITVEPVPDSPVFTSTPPGSVVAENTYTYLVTTQDADGEFARIEGGSMPDWLTLVDHGNGTATLSGTPGVADVGEYLLTLQAIDGDELTAEQSFTLAVLGLPSGVPTIVSPVNGSVLSGSSETFVWSAEGADVGRWRLKVGTAPGSSDLFLQGYNEDVLSTVVSGLPTDGSTVYARLEWRISGVVSGADYVYAAAAGGDGPMIVSPADGSVLSGDTETFSWTANGEPVGRWRLEIGTTPGSSDLYLQGFTSDITSTAVSGLPTDGSTVYVRLEWRISGVVSGADYVYTAAGGGAGTPAITSPVPGTILPTGDVNFAWSANGATVDGWQLLIGTSIGDNSLLDTGTLAAGTTSVLVSGLPEDGSLIHVTLIWTAGGVSNEINYTYTAASGGIGVPMMVSPLDGSILSGSTQTFTWSAEGAPVDAWRLEVGTAPGTTDIYGRSHDASVTSLEVSRLPTDGSTVYVRLKWKIDGVVSSADYIYTAAGP